MLEKTAKAYWQLIRGPSPIGFFLLLWPALWALWLAASGFPGWRLLGVFVLGSWLMRSAGCVLNDLADRHIDPHVSRTRERPLASGRLRPSQALGLLVVLLGLAASLLWFLPLNCTWLALLAVSGTCLYPFSKRFFFMPQLVLGVVFAMAVPMAFFAVQAQPAWQDVLSVMLPAVLWPLMYDSVYALMDVEDDRLLKIHSSPIFLGEGVFLFVSLLQAALLLSWCGLAWHFHTGLFFSLAIFYVAVIFFKQQRKLYEKKSAHYRAIFRQQGWLGMWLWLGLVLDFL